MSLIEHIKYNRTSKMIPIPENEVYLIEGPKKTIGANSHPKESYSVVSEEASQFGRRDLARYRLGVICICDYIYMARSSVNVRHQALHQLDSGQETRRVNTVTRMITAPYEIEP